MVPHTFNLSIHETEAGGLRVRGQCGPHRESQNQKMKGQGKISLAKTTDYALGQWQQFLQWQFDILVPHFGIIMLIINILNILKIYFFMCMYSACRSQKRVLWNWTYGCELSGRWWERNLGSL